MVRVERVLLAMTASLCQFSGMPLFEPRQGFIQSVVGNGQGYADVSLAVPPVSDARRNYDVSLVEERGGELYLVVPIGDLGPYIEAGLWRLGL